MLIIYDNSKSEVYINNVVSIETVFQVLISTGKFCSCTVEVLQKNKESSYTLCLFLEVIGQAQSDDLKIAQDFSINLSNILNDARLHGKFPYACEARDSKEIALQK